MKELVKLIVFVPESHCDIVRQAMGKAGAGKIGNYSYCSFSSKGQGRFLPERGADPAIGQVGKLEVVHEERIEVACERKHINAVIMAIKKVHPYEEVVIDIYPMLIIENDLVIENFRNAAKAFIVRDGKLFMLKRRPNDPHKPGKLDIPGGRLELGEDPFEGLKREVKEEINCGLEIVIPIDVKHFVREDGQKITLTMFLCNLLSGEIKLSEEHTEFRWIDLENDLEQIPEFFHKAIGNYIKYIKHD